MFDPYFSSRHRLKLLAVSLLVLTASLPAMADQPAPPSTLSMLEAMVASGVMTQAQADKILKDAQARDAARGIAPVAQPAQASSSSKSADGAVHVQYVPQAVKDQIKAEVKQEVMAKAQTEGWAAPNQTPEWTRRVKFSGDVRTRFEEDLYPHGNAAGTVDAMNFNALNNQSKPIDANRANWNGLSPIPYYNTNENRERARLRARLGVEADIGDGFTTGMRLATGADNSPVSTNQTLGGSGGNFSKYGLWLDRGYIKYEPLKLDADGYGVAATVGRFDNPFFSTSLIWADDMGFDGLAVQGKYQATKTVAPFVTVGAFPVYNTDLNFSTNNDVKTTSSDKWLYGVQAGTDWKASQDVKFKLAAAYYYFNNVEGRRQNCNYLDPTCGNDISRPSFAQRGNTYFALRNNIGYPGSGTQYEYQYFGLATPYHDLALTGKLDYDGLKPLTGTRPTRVSLDGEFVKNLAFDKSAIQSRGGASGPENNCASSASANCVFNGGDMGYMARLTVGAPALQERWDWNVSLAYKYIESDATVDAFVDPDFGMGGTNLKGYVAGGNLALGKNVWTSFKWMSADNIAGSSFSVDTVMLDLNAKF